MLPELAALPSAQRARVLLGAAKAELNDRLWQAALGEAGKEAESRTDALSAPAYIQGGVGLEELLRTALAPGRLLPVPPLAESQTTIAPTPLPHPHNQATVPYAAHLDTASQRTGIPAATLAAIVDAEAGRGPHGAWNPLSRNPRSSAAGLGQFLSATWLGMARQAGTWLNAQARAAGLVDAEGHIAPGAKSALLALRYDPQAAIETVADYARSNVARLRQAGASIGESATEIARAAYIGHQLGPGDAIRFYTGGLDAARARMLLVNQIGAQKAEQHIAQTGDASEAHRGWLLGYVQKFIG